MAERNFESTTGAIIAVEVENDVSNNPPIRAATNDSGSASIARQGFSTTSGKPPAAILGINYADQSIGVIGGRDHMFKQVAGVYGESPNQGVFGLGIGNLATGVYGISSGAGIGVRGESKDGVALQAQCFGNGRAAWLRGRVDIEGDLTLSGQVIGDLVVKGDVKLFGGDCAENFDLRVGALAAPGTVMVIDDDGTVLPCTQAYDHCVAGVVSGAGDFRPGVILHERIDDIPTAPLALIGKVFCYVDASYGAIAVGDMLTTSPTPGHAMKVSETTLAFGAVLGKALKSFPEGCGLIPVLVALQ